MTQNMLTTIFTATYNRSSHLKILFESLQRQTNKNFEWILVNDGSTDNTDEVVKELQARANFSFKYYKKENGGKHTAINYGIQYAEGEMWFMVDHDDYLSDDAIEVINEYYPKIKDEEKICAVTFLRHHHDGTPIGTQNNPNNIVTDFCSYRFKYRVKGDRAEVIKTEVFKKYLPFPVFKNEIYATEAILWNRIAKSYDSLFIANKNPIYLCEYLLDGLSLRKTKNPLFEMLYYNEGTIMNNVPLADKIQFYAHYWKNVLHAQYGLHKALAEINHKWGVLCFPLGIYLYIKAK
jgi:glycosyltransferase involved in cell wall biosynthesis